MLNVNDKILDLLDCQELYLVMQVARHIGVDGTAWPGMDRLAKLTGWSATTVKKVRARVIEKGILKKTDRKDQTGRDMSPKYQLSTPLIGIYIGSDKLAEIEGPQNDPLVKDRGHGLTPEGSPNDPEVLTIRSINHYGCYAQAQTFDEDELLDLDRQSETAKKEKKVAPKKEKAPQGLTPKTAAAASAIIAELRDRYESGSPAPVDAEPLALPQDATGDVLRWLREDPAGKQHWQTIRQYAKASPGELEDPEQTVLAAKCVLGEYVTSNFHQFKKRLHGFGLTQLNKDRRAAQNSTPNATRSNYRTPATGQRRTVRDCPSTIDYSDDAAWTC